MSRVYLSGGVRRCPPAFPVVLAGRGQRGHSAVGARAAAPARTEPGKGGGTASPPLIGTSSQA